MRLKALWQLHRCTMHCCHPPPQKWSILSLQDIFIVLLHSC